MEDGEKEPIGERIIEVPENTEATEMPRDPHAPFIAYVPVVGSIKKGEALVTTGGGKTTQCAACHGADLKGPWAGARNCGPLSQLSRAPALRHAGGRAQGTLDESHGRGRREAER